jgi:hypothetical protein
LGHADEIVITRLWKGITTERGMTMKRERKCMRKGETLLIRASEI